MKTGTSVIIAALCMILLAGCPMEGIPEKDPAPDTEGTYVMVPQFGTASPGGRGITLEGDFRPEFYYHQFAPEITGFLRLPSADVKASMKTEILGCSVDMSFRMEGKRQIFEGSFKGDGNDTQIYFRSDYDGKDSFDYVQKLVMENISMGGMTGGALYVITAGKDIHLDENGDYHGEMKSFVVNNMHMFFMGDGEVHSENGSAGTFVKGICSFMPDDETTKPFIDRFFADTDIEINDLSVLIETAIEVGDRDTHNSCSMFWRDGKGCHAVGEFYEMTMPGFGSFNKKEQEASGDTANFHDTYETTEAYGLFPGWDLVRTEESDMDGVPKIPSKWSFDPEEWKGIL